MTPEEIADYARAALMADDSDGQEQFLTATRDLAELVARSTNFPFGSNTPKQGKPPMPNLLRSQRQILTPEEIHNACDVLQARFTDAYSRDFLDSVQHYNREAYKQTDLSGRPIPDAADAVAAVAAHAHAMLSKLEAGWLWKILTIPTTPKEAPCPTEMTQSRKAEPCPTASKGEE